MRHSIGMPAPTPPSPLPAQPLLRRDAVLIVDGRGDLRIALSARHVVTVVDAPAGLAPWLRRLNGLLGLAQAVAAAPVDEEQAKALLSELGRAGLLADANHGVPFRRSSDEERDALRLAGRAPIATTPQRLVSVTGSRRWTPPVTSALQVPGVAAGHGWPQGADLVVIVADAFDPAGETASRSAMAAGSPHLSVLISAVDVSLLPLTLPGRTPCLRCWQLQRDLRTPDWGVWASPGAPPDPPLLPTHHRALVLGLIVEHTLAALAALGAQGHQPSTTPERYLDLRRCSVELRQIGAHPACGCIRAAA